MKRDYLAYLTGFEKSNMGEKINEYTGKRALDFCLKAEYKLFYRSDNYSFMTFSRCRVSR
jgi:hypothetical protein